MNRTVHLTYRGIPPVILTVIGLLSIILLWKWYVNTDESFRQHILLVDSMKEARADLTKAYLLAEKYWAGKETIQPGSVMLLLDSGLQKVHEGETGKSSLAGVPSAPAPEGPLRDRIARYEASVSAFRSSLQKSLERNVETRRYGAERSLFYAMEIEADGAMAALDKDLAESRIQTQTRFLITLGTWITLLAAAFVVLFLLERRQRRQAEALAYQNYLVNNVSDAIIAVNASFVITLWNDAAEHLYGSTNEEAVGKNIDAVVPSLDGATIRNVISTLSHATDFSLVEVQHQTRSGRTIPIEMKVHEIIDPEGLLEAYVMVNRDISTRKRFEEGSAEQAAILEAAEDAIFLRDPANRIRSWNRGAERIYGWSAEEVIGKDAMEILYHGNQDQANAIMKRLEQEGTYEGEITQYNREGRELVISARLTVLKDSTGKPKSILSVNRDVTERRHVELQLLRTQRLDSIGTLAGGIAHDLNNVLGPILLSIEVLRRRVADKSLHHILSTIETSARRGADLIRQVLSFAKGEEGERTIIQLKHLVREVERIVKETFPRSIQFESSIDKNLWTVTGDPTQLHQVLMNLCVNARDAMPHGGTLVVNAENVSLDSQYMQSHLEALAQDYVVLSVTDSGTGIPAEIRDKIFEPFFTTKEKGKGTGIGLSTVHSIVKTHKGFITLYSELGKGTTFRVHLPSDRQSLQTTTQADASLPPGKGETILIVDDESAVRQITQSTLETFGYHVLTASDGAEAVGRFAEHRSEIDLVLSDLMMPYMDGTAAARSLRKIKPTIKIILVSGLDESAKIPSDLSDVTFLRKPYTSSTLLTVIRNVLNPTD
jgi:PAS domain S-box-containing protein